MGLARREAEEDQAPIINGVDRNTKIKRAHVVKAKGVDSYAVERIAKEIMNLGYSKFVLKDAQEPSIKALREAVIRRIAALRGDLDIQIIPEESPVGESQSNGEVESAIKQVQGQFRTMRLSTD